MRLERVVIGTSIFMLVSTAMMGQQYMSRKSKNPIVCYANPKNANTHVDAPEKFQEMRRNKNARAKSSNFEVTYIGFSTPAKAAFQEAVDIWSTLVSSSVKIRVRAAWQPLGTNVLGSAIWGTVHANFKGAQRMNTFYPAALAEKMAKQDLNGPDEYEIYAYFNSDFDWYTGLTGTPGSGQYDLVTVVLHELGHGLGFVDSFSVQGNAGFVGVQNSGVPMIYDLYVENGPGQNIYHEFTNGTTALAAHLQTNAVYFNSPLVLNDNDALRARLYAPTKYSGGSSIAHLNESTYLEGNINSLMTPAFDAVEVIHDPGPIVMNAFSDMGWVFTFIDHTDLKNTENINGPFVVKAKVTSERGPVDTPKLHYIAGAPEVTVDMTPTGNADEYQATIPSTNVATTYAYYISTMDTLDRVYTYPGKLITPLQDEQQFKVVFTTGPDTQAPRIKHTPRSFILDSDTELKIEAIVTDNLGVDQVTIHYKINGVDKPNIIMTSGTPDSLYSAAINLGAGLPNGSKIEYTIVATDVSVAHNSATTPESGFHTVNVKGLAPTRDSYRNDFNAPSDDFFGDGFSITTPPGFLNPAIHSTHPYPEGDPFVNHEIFLTYQLQIPIRVRSTDATITFNQIAMVEPGEAGTEFGDANFFDYVVVEGSKDGGTNWTPIADGWDSRASMPWVNEWNSGFNGNNSTGVGTPELYRKITMSLLNKFDVGDEVVIRFRLYSDQLASGWGWSIDDLLIQVDQTPPVILHDHFDYLLASDEQMGLSMKVSDASQVRDLAVELQVADDPIQTIDFPVSENFELYTLNVDVKDLNPGDLVKYRIVAHDTTGNEGTFPSTGFINVPVLNSVTAVDEYTNDFNSGSSDFIGNFFSVTQPTNFSDNAIHSEHFYENGMGLDTTSSYSFILTKPVKLSATNPFMVYDEIAIVQNQASMIPFGSEAFNDYVIVEGSSDGGVTWKEFADGYDAVGQPSWVSAFNGVSSGTSSLYKRRTIDLLDNGNFKAGDEVLIRFRLFADKTMNGWGWSIDNLSIQGAITGTDESIGSTFKVYPNPASSEANVEFPAKGNSASVKVLNVQGQVLITQERTPVNGTVKTTIDVSALGDGLYLVRAESGGKAITKKFLKTSKK